MFQIGHDVSEEQKIRFLNMVTKHGLRYVPEYAVWLNMKSRCYNPNNKTYNYYGGRGIVMCQEWADSFLSFYTDMGQRPFKGCQIDRIDNNQNYDKDNCIWNTKVLNMRNSSVSKYWFVNGMQYDSLTHAAEILGVTINTVKRWCDGRIDGGHVRLPKNNCWSVRKYAE